MRTFLKLIFIFCLLTSCKKSTTLFTKLDKGDTGIDFKNWNAETEGGNILVYEYLYNGGGVALGDINNDGLLDIYFTSNSYENKLYLNKGNLEFEDITEASGTVCEPGWKTGVCMVDINGDGWLDIYVSRSGHDNPGMRKNILLINNKDLTFTDKAEVYGLADDSYSTQASFFDYDHDGDLDAFLLNHSLLRISNSFDITNRNTTKRFPFVGNKLLRNDNGKFVDVSDSLGVYGPGSNYGLGVSMSDLNNDSWTDVFTGCDYTGRDRLLLNMKSKFFKDATDSMLSHISKFTMGTDIADFNGDGLMDIVTLDMLPEDNRRQKLLQGADRYNAFNQMVQSGLHYQYMRNMLHVNMGNGYFSEAGQLAGISNTDWSWAPLIADFDNDGVQDLFVSNGFKRDLTNNDFAKYHAFQQIEEARRQGKQISLLDLLEKFKENKIHNYIYKGNDSLGFTNVVDAWGFEDPTLTNGVAYGDLDNDGDLDLVMNELNDIASIYRNNSNVSAANHYVQIALVGADNNKEAVGASATVYAGDRMFVRELFPVRGFQSSVDPVLHFGLGLRNHIDSVVVRWPKGEIQSVKNIPVDKKTVITEIHSGRFMKPVTDKTFFSKEDDVIDFTHHENDFVDFDIQALLPRKYSTMGPALAKGDVNNDGLMDLYAGGAKGQAGELFIQNKQGKFVAMHQRDFDIDKDAEDIDAVFFDADNDKDVDLYVVSGGYEFDQHDKLLQDRLYLNDGRGMFKKAALPEMLISGSCVRPSDIDNDGDVDLFVGGRIIPGRYPETPESTILINNGKGIFSVAAITEELKHIGMVTDAMWVDLNHDKTDDLIIVGEWMGIEIFLNNKGTLTNKTGQFLKTDTHGWWNCITKHDFDHDGDDDFIVGNLGLNNIMKASEKKPVTMIFNDYDNNGSVDPILNYYIMGKSYPYPTRDELTDQLPSFKKRFTDYGSYADADLEKVLTKDELDKSKTLHAVQMQNIYLRNDGDHLTIESLPVEMQLAPVFAVEACDANSDGKSDFIAMGNLSGTRARTGKLTGNTGFLFLGDGKGKFKFVSPQVTGFRCVDDVRKIVVDKQRVIVASNNAPVQCYILKK